MSEDLPEGKSLVLLRTWGHVYIGASWRALCPGVRGHRGVKGLAEGKKNVGNRNQAIWGAWWGPGHTGLSKLHEELYLILRK